MKTKKQSRVDLLNKKVDAIIAELSNIRTLSIGTLETIKKMPGYGEAIAELTKKSEEKN
jgi:hypothetical protein